ncbi:MULTISPECIES: sensor domain-containing diguanylate cyclase [Pseudomonas]|uniref:sensor domain-containing diguanylate cyclase n=1 Tax=Pseudomonas TaxID=286 RepID=UPI0002D78F86|nr:MULTISPECIES: sensor domain-containing diguanylate cyclase [Pseudomonas]MBB3272097.1 diguanylate cyclase (GGDEF)-like protein [Pseudomonas sp. OG7]
MPSRSALFSQRSLIVTLLLLLACGFLATSLLSYFSSRSAIRDGIINTELPLTSDTVYSEIQKDLIRPVLIASMMAQDTFLRDWVLSGEKDTQRMTRYLGEVMGKQGTFTSFFVSDRTLTYYQAKGVLKQVQAGTWRDAWYFRLRDLKAPYEINVDLDMANQDSLTVFINYQVHDYQHRFIGAAGVGLSVSSVVKLIDQYQRRYQRSVVFVDAEGKVLLTGSEGGPHGLRVGQPLSDNAELNDVLAEQPVPGEGSHEYHDSDNHSHFLNVRHLPELDWYLLVDKRETGALDRIRHSLYLNLAICAMITLVVLALVHAMVRRHQASTEALATLDSLTGLPNRRSFDLLAAQALHEAQRDSGPLVALLIDLDHFKALNDTHGHLAGDEVLRQFANVLQGSLRQSDILCRWGGEEFIVLLREAEGRQAIEVAEKIRRRTEQLTFSYDEHPLRLTTSIGLSSLQPGDTLHALLTRADRALYRAKQAGRNRVCSETQDE